ncbi:SusD/RagB family nutrient-binding outer membrane lipoprotein [Spirosoma sp. KUDC1026]|uniref:SusD/RagB family nutrient-binding outer membrane lipoprotein n=1 Tax=Spirosoma sp. KUDC1026 TaxID=2745947 RepID=UPI00159B9315|nr:SusD/RagB family nutrient-binding outer membrane lipoprotein [Spirosoma sp. KUDC1026]QKZ12290.1 SusD/RagB family nutrient-binding outer membrane lipoprotein [Spirosoma sp. KUDC1026]
MKRILSIFSLSALFVVGSCTQKFDQMNVDPNNPTAVGPQYLLPFALETSIDRYWGSSTRFERLNLDGAMLWMQYLSRNIYSNEGDNYGVSVAFYNNNWRGFFNDGLLNYQRIITLSQPGGRYQNTNYEGIGLVMRTWVYSILTDVYGAIPYSEALKGTADAPIYTPAYDTMETVYAGMLADLKTANEKLIVGGPAVSGDILYNGDILKWKKFANSLRLRLANRQAAKKPAESRAIMAEILGNATTYPIFTSNADNAVLKNTATRPSNNEWNEVFVYQSRTDWNISKTLSDKLTALNDARLRVYAQPNSQGQYVGHANGLPDAIATTYLASSSVIGTYFSQLTTPSVLMTFAELNLTLAEAAVDGDISGSAQTYFERGITASFDQYGLQVSSAYLTGVGAATKAKVMEQKWIALFGQGVESWIEYRRTGLPVLPAKDPRAVFENNGVLPTRLQYPTSEYSLNEANLRKGITLNGGADNMQTKLWWAEN